MSWYAIRTETQREFLAASQLKPAEWTTSGRRKPDDAPPHDVALAIVEDVCLPLIKARVNRYHGMFTEEQRPAIRGYLFAKFDVTDALLSAIAESRGVMSIMPKSNRPHPIPDASMDAMRAVFDEMAAHTALATVHSDWIGKSYRVEAGPFAGYSGPCVSIDERKGAGLLLPCMGTVEPIVIPFVAIDPNPICENIVDVSTKKRQPWKPRKRQGDLSPGHTSSSATSPSQ